MAWPNAGGLGGGNTGPGNGTGGPDTGMNGGQLQGTEYTLQGVMRFLQTEWHRHERDRNAWQIERAEMRARIGKLEGDLRTNKKLRESMDKHVRMLENVLKKKEAEKKGKPLLTSQENGQVQGSNVQDIANGKPPPPKSQNSFLAVDHDDPSLHTDDAKRERSRTYLLKCLEEFNYHIINAPQNPDYLSEQEQMLQHDHYMSDQQAQEVSLADVYAQRHQKQHNSIGSLGPSPLPNHQPPPIPRASNMSAQSRMSQQAEDDYYSGQSNALQQHDHGSNAANSDRSNNPHSVYVNLPEESSDSTPLKYDTYGEPHSSMEEEQHVRLREEPESEIGDWNFNDPSEPPPTEEEQGRSVFNHPQRPDTDIFPSANNLGPLSPNRHLSESHRRKTSLSRRRQSDGSHDLKDITTSQSTAALRGETGLFKVRFALRGHLDVVRAVIFTGGGSPAAPEICSAGDDGVIKRWIAASSAQKSDDLDLKCDQTHRGHVGAVLALAASPAYQPFSNGGRAQGDGWVFSGGQDATVRIWERGRVDPKATLDGHTDAVWAVCVLPGTSATILGDRAAQLGGPDRSILISGSADGVVLVWAVSSPPQIASPHTGSRRGTGGSRRANSISSGSNFSSSPQPNATGSKPFYHNLVHRIEARHDGPSPTCISPLGANGETFIVSYADASVIVYDTQTGDEIACMASQETYDGTPATAVNAVAASTAGADRASTTSYGRSFSEDEHSATGTSGGLEGTVLSGHEDCYIRFFDANSGQCTYTMLAHPAPISSISLSPNAAELVSAGHDASLRFWNLEKRSCTQEVTSHRLMRGEGVCSVVWSMDGRWVVSGGGDGVVKVFTRGNTGDEFSQAGGTTIPITNHVDHNGSATGSSNRGPTEDDSIVDLSAVSNNTSSLLAMNEEEGWRF